MSATRSMMTLLSMPLIVLAMAGCTTSSAMPEKPTAPSGLTVMAGDGIVCYSERDHASLMTYIIELERGY